MTTGWLLLLLLLLLVLSQSVDGQPTTDDEVCSGGGLLSSDRELLIKLQRDVEKILQRLGEGKPRNCLEVRDSGRRSDGIYTVYIGCSQCPVPVRVYCDMTTDGGGWTVFQRRQDGSVDFYRNWSNYTTGFGNLSGEFWLGNDNLHLLTSDTRQRLRVDLADFEGNSRYAEYDRFEVDSAAAKYRLVSLGAYTGTAGDSLTPRHLEQKFSTRDQDNDLWPDSCAQTYKGGWWYSACHTSNLNGLYLRGNHTPPANGVEWVSCTGGQYSLRFTEMKIRPFNV